MSTAPTTRKFRALVPVGGYANAIGVHLTALNEGLAEIEARAKEVPAGLWAKKIRADVATPAELLLHVGDVEARWIHHGIGGKPPAIERPPVDAPPDRLLAYLKTVRAQSAVVLKPLVEADLDRLRDDLGSDGALRGKATVRQILVDALEHQAYQWGRVSMLVRILSA